MAPSIVTKIGCWFMKLVLLALLVGCGYMAYTIRLKAINIYGRVIHEFDPWFNFRATQYLADNGWYEFFHWFDYKVWYPLGRPVGTTIYPGMQITSVVIWKVLGWIGDPVNLSLNDVCCFVPAWFGVSATILLGLIAGECSGSWSAIAASSAIMAIIPAHIMRSVGGGYDNESIAITAMCLTFYTWVRALRPDPKITDGSPTRDSYVYGFLCGLAYVYMVAAWGGFVFVLNLVGVHAALLVVLGRYSSKLHRAYSLFFAVGTFGAVHVPVVGWNPFKSLEQLGPFVVFIIFQLLEYCEVQRRKRKLTLIQTFVLRVKCAVPVFVACGAVVVMLYPTGYFGPFTSRVRGLFVKHTRTGNPLVDSVAEHQPASAEAYRQYLNAAYDIAPYGFALMIINYIWNYNEATSFLVVYAIVAYFFSSKMSRLIILLGPVASALGGVSIGFLVDELILFPLKRTLLCERATTGKIEEVTAEEVKGNDKEDKKKPQKKTTIEALTDNAKNATNKVRSVYNHRISCAGRMFLALYLTTLAIPQAKSFYEYCDDLAAKMSGPSIMFEAQLTNGKKIIVDDYREAYWWLTKHTPEDARILSWWDYGYQITGIGNRTTLADGNTWNHEHIATLGRILSGSEETAHRIARHLADYVLVWSGGGGDDLAKSPHMARIGNSVYHDICPGDPTCSQFGFMYGGRPTPMMEKCLLYKMVKHGSNGVRVDGTKFQHVFSSKYDKVRIFKIKKVSKKSKDWVADPANRVCDAPGSWYCSGQYPPALNKLIAKRKAFRQLEDFNTAEDADADEYTKEYLARMAGQKGGSKKGKAEKTPQQPLKYVGCYAQEDDLPTNKKYGGGESGAMLKSAVEFAFYEQKKYVAIARVENDGHSFAMDRKPPKSKRVKDDGCKRACPDDGSYACGCSDAACEGLIDDYEPNSNARRWVVYEIDRKKIEAAQLQAQKEAAAAEAKKNKKSKKKKGKKKGKKKSKSEL